MQAQNLIFVWTNMATKMILVGLVAWADDNLTEEF